MLAKVLFSGSHVDVGGAARIMTTDMRYRDVALIEKSPKTGKAPADADAEPAKLMEEEDGKDR